MAERTSQVAVLVSKNFDDSMDANSKADLDGLLAAAKGLLTTVRRGNGGTPQTPTPAALAALNAALRTAEDKVIQHIFKDACKVLSAGCFAAGTKLWTPDGYRNIEDIRAGERVYSRDEWDERGDIAAKIVEEVFTRYAGVYDLRVGGQVIRTTGEHESMSVTESAITRVTTSRPRDPKKTAASMQGHTRLYCLRRSLSYMT